MNMYDKLGNLLNETLETGYVKFVRLEPDNNLKNKKEENFSGKTEDESTNREKKIIKPNVYKKITPELEYAYKVLGLEFTATKDDLKKAYKEKLIYFHPDKHIGNEIIEKVATKKTSEIIKSYNLILDFLEK